MSGHRRAIRPMPAAIVAGVIAAPIGWIATHALLAPTGYAGDPAKGALGP